LARWKLDPIDPDRVRVLLCQEGSDSSKFALYDSHNPISANETVSGRMSSDDVSRSWNGTQLQSMASRANDIVGSLTEGRRSGDYRSYSVKTLPVVSGHDSLSQQRKVIHFYLVLIGSSLLHLRLIEPFQNSNIGNWTSLGT
jgi:hypothetical protein